MKYIPVKAVSVYLWGRRVGVLVHAYDQYSRFEYDPGVEVLPVPIPVSDNSHFRF